MEYKVAPTHTTGGFGNGKPGSSPLKGLSALQQAILAGTITRGDSVVLSAERDNFNMIAEQSDGVANYGYAWNNVVAANAGIASGSTTGPGVNIGDAMSSVSKASGIRFTGADGSRIAVLDARHPTGTPDNANRMTAALTLRGEDITCENVKILPSTHNYVDAINTSNVNPESVSYENIGLLMPGAGNIAQDIEVDGDSGVVGFSRFGVAMIVPNQGMSTNYSQNKRNIARRLKISGCFHDFALVPGGPGGGGNLPKFGQEVYVEANDFFDPAFGRRAGAAKLPYLGSSHGGVLSISGNYPGRIFLRDNKFHGNCQDLTEVVGAGAFWGWNQFYDCITMPTALTMVWNATLSRYDYVAMGIVSGNAAKLGLQNDGTPPGSWLGLTTGMGGTGVIGGSSNSMESAHIMVGNKFWNISGFAIAPNGTSGHMISYNEGWDLGLGFFECWPSFAGTYFLNHNYGALAAVVNSPNMAALYVRNAGTKIHEYNNVWDAGANAAARGVYDAAYANNTGTRNASSNTYAQGRILQSGTAWSFAADKNAGAATDISAYVRGKGFPRGHALSKSADRAALALSRVPSAMFRDASRGRIVVPANPGPYTRGF